MVLVVDIHTNTNHGDTIGNHNTMDQTVIEIVLLGPTGTG
jgi:hypothetical protein